MGTPRACSAWCSMSPSASPARISCVPASALASSPKTIDQFVWISDSRGHRNWYNEAWVSATVFRHHLRTDARLGLEAAGSSGSTSSAWRRTSKMPRSGQPWEYVSAARRRRQLPLVPVARRADPRRAWHRPALAGHEHRRHRTARAAGRAAAGASPQGRIPGHARAPVAQSGGAHRERGEVLTRLLDGDKEAGAGGHRPPPGSAPGAPAGTTCSTRACITEGREPPATIVLQGCVDLAVETA